MLDLKQRGSDVRGFVRDLEEWLIQTLAAFNVKGERREGRVGIWVARGVGREDKIAAIGVRVRKWVTFHGVSVQRRSGARLISQALYRVASVSIASPACATLEFPLSMADVDTAMKAAFAQVFRRKIR